MLAGRRKWWKGPERTKRAGALSRTEAASGGQVLLLARRAMKMRLVQQEAIHSLWSRLFCGPFKMHSVEQEAV